MLATGYWGLFCISFHIYLNFNCLFQFSVPTYLAGSIAHSGFYDPVWLHYFSFYNFLERDFAVLSRPGSFFTSSVFSLSGEFGGQTQRGPRGWQSMQFESMSCFDKVKGKPTQYAQDYWRYMSKEFLFALTNFAPAVLILALLYLIPIVVFIMF